MPHFCLHVLLSLVFILFSCHCKEKNAADKLVNLNHLQKLAKRVDGGRHAVDSLDDVCDYAIDNGSIIRTNDSITAGAAFLRYMKQATRDECINHCCYTQGCSVAIYEEKVGHDCYLFDCGHPNRCKFASHEGYVSLKFAVHLSNSPTVKSEIKQHEDELEGLEQLGTRGRDGNQKPSTTPTATTTTVRTTTTTRQPVYLFAPCDELDECADQHAECQSGSCDCQNGFQAKYGKCRQQCRRYQFECDNKGVDTGPVCIDFALACDGTPQCTDGSDELDCSGKGPDSSSVVSKPKHGQYRPQQQKPNILDEYEYHHNLPSLHDDRDSQRQGGNQRGNDEDYTENVNSPREGGPPAHEQNVEVSEAREPADSKVEDKALPFMDNDDSDNFADVSKVTSEGMGMTSHKANKNQQKSRPVPANTRGDKPSHSNTLRPLERISNPSLEKTHEAGTNKAPESDSNMSNIKVTNNRLSVQIKGNVGHQKPSPSPSRPSSPGRNFHDRQPPRTGYGPQRQQQTYPYSPPYYDYGNDYGNGGYLDRNGGQDYPSNGSPQRYDYRYRDQDYDTGLYPGHRYKGFVKTNESNGRDGKPVPVDVPETVTPGDTDTYKDPQDGSPQKTGNDNDMQQQQQPQQGDNDTPDITEEENLDEDYYENHGEIIPGANEPPTPGAKFNGEIDSKQTDNNEAEDPIQKESAVDDSSSDTENIDTSYHVKKVVVSSITDSAQGPIIALAIGLAITLILLVGVVCRLRTVKRRIRRGKLLHSHEADYLINGMYL